MCIQLVLNKFNSDIPDVAVLLRHTQICQQVFRTRRQWLTDTIRISIECVQVDHLLTQLFQLSTAHKGTDLFYGLLRKVMEIRLVFIGEVSCAVVYSIARLLLFWK